MTTTTAVELSSRDRVLSAAQQLIIDHGYVDFSMRELAEVSGLAKATIYHHFADKQTICYSVIEMEFAELRDRIAAAAQSTTDPVVRLRAVIDELLGPPLERRLVVLQAVQGASGLGEHFRDIIKRYRTEMVAPIADIIQDGIRSGAFRSVNVEMTVISLLGIMQSYITHRSLVAPDEQFQDIAGHTTELLLHGISKRA